MWRVIGILVLVVAAMIVFMGKGFFVYMDGGVDFLRTSALYYFGDEADQVDVLVEFAGRQMERDKQLGN